MHRWARYIYVLGGLFFLLAAAQSLLKVVGGGSAWEATIDLVLIGFPGLLLLFVGRRLARSEIDPRWYPRIAVWCLTGVAVLFVFVFLRAIHPGVTTSFSFGTRAIALSIGSVAGLAIGIHEAQALTRRRQVERQNATLARTREELEQRNAELSRTRTRLEQTVEKLEASNERLDQFATTASHDLREPLRMISQYLALLERRHGDQLDEEASEFVEFAVDGADRLETMVEDLLRFARVETEGRPLEPVHLDAVVADVLQDLDVRIEETDAEITVDALPRVRGDASQLRQLFQNLVQNALTYSGDEPPQIRITATECDDGWECAVSDDGIGISPDDRERIFELFERLHGVGEHEGSGIGLALCRRIVERHGGEIRVESTPGEGSTFSVVLPAVTDGSRSPTATAKQ